MSAPDDTKTTAYKGFSKDLTCRGFQYAEGETFTHDGPVAVCDSGFHAVELPLDVLTYYPLSDGNQYRVVALRGVQREGDGDSKVAAREITVGAALSLFGLIKAHVGAIWRRAGSDGTSDAVTTGRYANAATTGRYANAVTAGDYANAVTTGDYAHAVTTGYCAHAVTTGYSTQVRASVGDRDAVAAVLGQGAAKGVIGSWLVLTERDSNRGLLGVKAVQVDGETVKADTYYMLSDGEIEEATE